MEDSKRNAEKAGSSSLSAETGNRRERVEILPLSLPFEIVPEIPGMVGTSARMRLLAAEIVRKARYEYDVLIEGETGTGKTIAASAIHAASSRADKPFVKVNSAAFQKDLFESELFGHEKGAFTGATERRIGILEKASSGIVFFDEIAEMPLDLQAKVLTALEEKRFCRLGGREPIECDLRILYATRRNLETMIEAGTFREDLYYRIKTLRIRVPSLDERRDDIPALVHDALARFNAKHGFTQEIIVEDSAMAMLLERAWPGNIRELQHAITELAVSLDERTIITARDVDAVLGPNIGVLSVGERPNDAKTIIVPPYLIGEDYKHYLDRIFIFIYNTLLKESRSPKRVSEIMKADVKPLSQRLTRAHRRLRAAAETARLLVGSVDAIGRVRRYRADEESRKELRT